MKLHPREHIVTEARMNLMNKLVDWQREYPGLTDGELFWIVGQVLGGKITSLAKYMIRFERHGDTDTPGGLE